MSDGAETSAAISGMVLDGQYRLLRLISEGGMGVVYEAIQLKLDRRVAVKIMARALGENPEALARFRREVKITSKLAHPHIVQLLDFGATAEGQPYLVTEYLDGEDLEQRLVRVGRMSLAVALPIIRQIVSAMTAIHAHAFVHRDLKPANILLVSVDGVGDFVKLLDFGISKSMLSGTQLTQPSSVLGTPGYMSPEQAAGRTEDVDHRTDQWALACVCWQMLTGQPPAGGAEPDATAFLSAAIATDDAPTVPPVSPDAIAGVAQALQRALSNRQSQRFPTVKAFLRALESAVAAPKRSQG